MIAAPGRRAERQVGWRMLSDRSGQFHDKIARIYQIDRTTVTKLYGQARARLAELLREIAGVDRDDDLRQHLEEDVDRLREAIQNAFEKSGESPPVISS